MPQNSTALPTSSFRSTSMKWAAKRVLLLVLFSLKNKKWKNTSKKHIGFSYFLNSSGSSCNPQAIDTLTAPTTEESKLTTYVDHSREKFKEIDLKQNRQFSQNPWKEYCFFFPTCQVRVVTVSLCIVSVTGSCDPTDAMWSMLTCCYEMNPPWHHNKAFDMPFHLGSLQVK